MEIIDISIDHIYNIFDEKTIERGKQYYSSNKVIESKEYKNNRDANIILFSKVEGSEDNKYDQQITIEDSGKSIMIHGECSCFVGYNCKHVVAVLFEIVSQAQEVETKEDEINIETKGWLDKILEISSLTSNKTKPAESALIYRLFEYKANDSSDIEFYKAKLLKNGSLSKGSFVSRDTVFHDYTKEDYIDDNDKKLISSLYNLIDSSIDRYSQPIKFRGQYGTIVLKELIDSGKCYFQSSMQPLVFGESSPKSLEFAWKEGESSSEIVTNLRDDEYLISTSTPLLCIDSTTNHIYSIDSNYTNGTLEFMLNAPPIPNQNLLEVTQQILEKLPNIDFPIPSQLESREVEAIPIPHLSLYGESGNKHLMKLEFLYDEYKVASHSKGDTSVIFKNNQNIKVIRDIEKESSFRERIENLGFIFEPNSLAYLSSSDLSIQIAIERWREFMTDTIPILIEKGWEIDIADNFNYQFEYIDTVTVESSETTDTNPWFSLSFSVEIGGKKVSLLPIVSSLLKEFNSVEDLPPKLNLEMENGKFLHINAVDIKPILRTIFELFDRKDGDNLIIKPFDAHLLDIDEDADIIWKGATELKGLSKKLKNFKGIEPITPSPNLQAELREYQEFGISWLNFLHEFKFSGILADDMGLGKTVQTLAFLQILKERGELTKPSLIVMPTSLIGNWKNEIKKFTPNLNFLELYGLDRAFKFDQIKDHDIILTTYSLAQRDEDKYKEERFEYIILDEAQKIKNPRTKLAISIKSFRSDYKLALSGTPIENHLGELWSIFDFLMSGFLDNLKTFKSFYQNPIEQEFDKKRRELLNKKIAPFILRRTKDEVVLELPAKTEIIKKAKFDEKQAKLYENIRVTMEQKVREAIAGKGLSRSHITILDALLKLRQVCCHPQLLKLESAKNIHESAKLDMFLELIDDLNLEGRKVLVFSQFTSMLSILEEEIKKRNISYTKLTGSTKKREEAIEAFTKGDASIFLISLKAGGVGLNLVEADTVIHYDPWWNPAVENQATDRAYRIGQDKPVFVYKLIVENSIEEQIIKLQEKKKALQAGIYEGNEAQGDKFDGGELVELLRL
ncbi:MAG: DEAD/DEAH box helicase [Sulfurovum sp.]